MRRLIGTAALSAAALLAAAAIPAGAAASGRIGALDCNGFSPAQHAFRPGAACTDPRGLPGVDNEYSSNGRFYDNGHYIGHDEPDMTFLSSQHGSGNDVTWTETLGRDPAADPTVAHPGSDITNWFELSIAPWFSMELCNPKSFPLRPCTPQSDSNAPHGSDPGGGSSFLEVQFYPPGFPPFIDSISCDDAHWCASLHVNDLECNLDGDCNDNCIEPTNFAFIQTNGVPTGPPSPQKANFDTQNPNSHTLLMNPGDRITVHIFNAPVPGHPGQKALEVFIRDLTTGRTGFMQASAANGYQATSIKDCSGTPFNYQPEFDTAKRENISSWTALQTDVSTQFEIGHFEPCTSVTDPITIGLGAGHSDMTWQFCHGPYEETASPDPANAEGNDAPCYPKGDTHGALHSPPDRVTGCAVFLFSGGDIDFDGTSYWPDWPLGPAPTRFPGSFVQDPPTSSGGPYERFFIQTDVALSETTCTGPSTEGCAVPPPEAPGHFYPYWSRVGSGSGPACKIEFGNVHSGPNVHDYGKDAQYGSDQRAVFGYDEFIGPVMPNTCGT